MAKEQDLITQENPNYNKGDFNFIEMALSRAAIYQNLGEINKNNLRLIIDSKNESDYIIHIGSIDPYAGGSGSTYIINRQTSDVLLDSVETYSPAPDEPKLDRL